MQPILAFTNRVAPPWEMAVLQKLGGQIADCWARAEEAERRASEATDLAVRADHERAAKSWRHLARSYEFVESLERFLLDAERAKAAHARGRAICCPYCGRGMRLLGIEHELDSRDVFSIECIGCGHLEVIGAPTR